MIEQMGILLTLIQWLHAIQSGRKTTTEAATIQNYLEWLRRHNHEELVTAVESSAQAQARLEQLIFQRHDELLQMGDLILKAMSTNQQVLLAEFADVKSALAGILASISNAPVAPGPKLSKEALEILRIAAEGDGDMAVVDHPQLKLVRVNPSSQTPTNLTDRHYVQAVDELVSCNFAKYDGGDRWVICRPGEDFIKSLKESAT